MRQGQRRFAGRSTVVTVCVALSVVGAAVADTPAAHFVEMAARTAPAWQARQLPVPIGSQSSRSQYVGPVVCTGAGTCVALGEYTTAGGVNEDSILTESSGRWTAVRARLPLGGVEAANFGPYGLACAGTGNCVGTSVYLSSRSLVADVLQEVNGTWSSIALPVPANARRTWPSIAAVACPVAGGCVIAGAYTTTAGLSEGLIVTEKAGRFVAAEAPTPGGNGSDKGAGLAGVACSGATACVAAGYYVAASGERDGLLVADRGGKLAAATALLPTAASPDPAAVMQGVACGSATGCVALGQYENSVGDHVGVIDASSNGHWSTASMPTPASPTTTSPDPVIYAVACRDGTSCLAAGRYVDSSSDTEGLALLQRSTVWSASTPPGTAGTTPSLNAVACSNLTSCTAVGGEDVGGKRLGYIMVMGGRSLTGSAAPVPSNASADPDEVLGSISCPITYACTAIGTYTEKGHPSVRFSVAISQ
jgi:hypothetical protein